jgi:hypothetical protein
VTEALLTSFILIAALAFLSCLSLPQNEEDGRLRVLSNDILSIVSHRHHTDGHPALEKCLESDESWDIYSENLDNDIRKMLPEGIRYHLSTPYGDIGDRVPDGAEAYHDWFQAYSADNNEAIEGRITLWHP